MFTNNDKIIIFHFLFFGEIDDDLLLLYHFALMHFSPHTIKHQKIEDLIYHISYFLFSLTKTK